MGDLKYLLPILVAVILVWITYLIINFVATIIKTKKKIRYYKRIYNKRDTQG